MSGNDLAELIDFCMNLAPKMKIDPYMCDVCIRSVIPNFQTPCCKSGLMCDECELVYKNNIKICSKCAPPSVAITVE